MRYDLQLILTAAGCLTAGGLIVWLLLHAKVRRAKEDGRAEALPEIQRLTADLGERSEKIRVLEARCADTESKLQTADKELAVARDRNEALPKLEADLAAAAGRERAVLGEISELKTRLEEQRKQAEEKLALLSEAKSELTNQFRVLAQEILEEKGRVFDQQSRAGLKVLLDPFKEQIGEFRKKVDDIYVSEARERASLKTEIESLRSLNQQISQEAVNLTRALKGDKKAQGTWGEMILERVLEQSGLRKGVEYETQGTFRDADGRLLRPDVVVHLPDEKDVVIDSKVSLSAYERCVSAEDDAERSGALAEHVDAVRIHIETLSAKDYTHLKGVRSLEFVMMFMPIEAAFVAAFREDEGLFTKAFEKRIVVVTPTTLLVTLRTIESIWRYERQNRNAQAIFERAAAIYDKFRLFVESMDKLGKQIDTVQGTYDEAMNRMVRGKGNVMSQLSRFSELGVSVKKELPRTITDVAEIDGADE